MDSYFRQKRLKREAASVHDPSTMKELANNGIRMIPDELDISHWIVEMRGPVGTPYEGGTFYLLFEAPEDYPFGPPRVRFITDIFHMNISCGFICVDILHANEVGENFNTWCISMTFEKIALSLASFLGDPNPVPCIADLFESNPTEYYLAAKKHTLLYASITIDDCDLATANIGHIRKVYEELCSRKGL